MTPRVMLAAPAQHAEEIRKSRFVVHALPIHGPDEAEAALATASDRAATHNCWAWRHGERYRFHDDGEPAGSAGRPILIAIDGQGFDRVAVLVTRWFGGIKLGVGGLVRAYGGSAAECLRRAPRQPIIAQVRLGFVCDFATAAILRSRLAGFAGEIVSEVFATDAVEFELALPCEREEDFRRWLGDASRGRADPRVLD